jgi:hypothetical protein
LTKRKTLHLTISAIIIAVIAFTYGLFPTTSLPKLFDFNVEPVDLKNAFRATMGLYLGMVILWVIGVFKPVHWRTATITNVFFMTGLASGRIISLVVDGVPSLAFSIGLALELTLALWGIRNLNRYRATADQ